MPMALVNVPHQAPAGDEEICRDGGHDRGVRSRQEEAGEHPRDGKTKRANQERHDLVALHAMKRSRGVERPRAEEGREEGQVSQNVIAGADAKGAAQGLRIAERHEPYHLPWLSNAHDGPLEEERKRQAQRQVSLRSWAVHQGWILVIKSRGSAGEAPGLLAS